MRALHIENALCLRKVRAARALALLLGVAPCLTTAEAQTAVDSKTVFCVYDGSSAPEGLSVFSPETAFLQDVDTILDTVTLNRPKNFVLLPGSVENAAATFENGIGDTPPRRVILYNQQYFALLPRIAGPFGRYAVLAHEIGHHLNGHSENPTVDLQREIQADRFAGRVLASLGASIEETTAVLSQVSELPTRTHPGRPQRRAAMVNGWIQQKPDTLTGPAVQVRLSNLGQDRVQRHSGDFVVDGTTLVDEHALIADRIVFRKDAHLVFSRLALARSNSFYLVAREIISDPQGEGTISWEKPVPPEPPGSIGQAATGRHGRDDGENGAPGQPGLAGANGYSGDDAPALILAVQKMTSKLLIDLEGHGGGPGSMGQKGGDGGNGQRGSHASQDFFNCDRGAGDGGSGGAGGPGGPGGVGGRGGRGGTFTLLAGAGSLPSIKENVQINVTGGEGGSAGTGGPSGDGGLGGPRGAPAFPFCRDDGRDGPSGNPGPPGAPGAPGPRGPDGQFAVGVLATEQFRDLLTPQ